MYITLLIIDCGLELLNSKLRYSNYFTSVYMIGFLKFGHIAMYNYIMHVITQ